MQNYRNSGAHRQAMLRIQKWTDEAAVVHWEQADNSLPNVVEAHSRIVADGRFTRLANPSLAHLERKIPEPSLDLKGLLLYPRKKVQPTRELESQI